MQEGEGGGELRSGPPSGKPAGVRPSRLARASVVATRPSGAYFLKKIGEGGDWVGQMWRILVAPRFPFVFLHPCLFVRHRFGIKMCTASHEPA
jgi:hypothetical protein